MNKGWCIHCGHPVDYTKFGDDRYDQYITCSQCYKDRGWPYHCEYNILASVNGHELAANEMDAYLNAPKRTRMRLLAHRIRLWFML